MAAIAGRLAPIAVADRNGARGRLALHAAGGPARADWLANAMFDNQDWSMNRRSELDLLRVIAIAILLVYHVGMVFNGWEWYLKNPEPLRVLEEPMAVLHQLRMPLLMVIAGCATAIALERRSIATVAADRVKRLFLPLVFGMFVVVPPQIYIERVATGGYTENFLTFYPSVLQLKPYPEGNFGWHHLWFIAYLFLYSIAAIPMFFALATPRGRRLLGWLDRAWARGWIVVLFIPLALARIAFPGYSENHLLFDDPDTLVGYALLFGFGHFLGRSRTVWDHVVLRRRRYLATTCVLFAVMVPLGKYPAPFEQLGLMALVWSVILAALGWTRWFFQRPGGYVPSWLDHAQKLSYPFYIVHQTVLIVLGWAWMQLPIGAWPRAGLLLVSTFIVTLALCELIARIGPIRPLFGMAPVKLVAPTLARIAPGPSHSARARATPG